MEYLLVIDLTRYSTMFGHTTHYVIPLHLEILGALFALHRLAKIILERWRRFYANDEMKLSLIGLYLRQIQSLLLFVSFYGPKTILWLIIFSFIFLHFQVQQRFCRKIIQRRLLRRSCWLRTSYVLVRASLIGKLSFQVLWVELVTLRF